MNSGSGTQMRRERERGDDLQPGKWEPGCENPDASCDPGAGAAGTGGSGDQVRGGSWSRSGTQIGGHTHTDTDRGRNTGIVGESERRWIMDIPMAGDISALVTAGQEMGSHGKQRGNMIVLRRVSDCLFLEIIITFFTLLLINIIKPTFCQEAG